MSKITRYRGDTYAIEAVLKKDGTPIDLSAGNYTAKFSFAKGTKRHIINGVNGNSSGEVSFPFPSDVTAGTYTYDIQVTSSSGEIQTYTKDILEIVTDITN